MSAQHTPGPWVHCTEGFPKPDVRAASGRSIAITWMTGPRVPRTAEGYRARCEEDRANARLIAAAPDMLAALHTARAVIENDREAFVDCSKVHRSRAENAVEHGLVMVGDGVWIEPEDGKALRDYENALAQIDAAIAKAEGKA